jgi:hypothetical protein
MKTHIFKIKSLIYFGLTLAALVACNKKDDSSGNIATTPYVMQNGNCVNSANGQIVAPNLCTNGYNNCNNGLNNGYYMNGGYCYSPQGQVVSNVYCTQVANGGMNGGYYMNGAYCYSPQGQVVSNVYCQNTNTMCNNGLNNGGYYMNGAYCYSPQGQVVSNVYCTQGANGMGLQCYGSYLYQSGYWSQMVQCAGANCRGYTLYDMNSRQTVNCQ